MATERFRTLTAAEEALLAANKIDPDSIIVVHNSDSALIMTNSITGDQIAIYAGPKSKREFPGVWEEKENSYGNYQ